MLVVLGSELEQRVSEARPAVTLSFGEDVVGHRLRQCVVKEMQNSLSELFRLLGRYQQPGLAVRDGFRNATHVRRDDGFAKAECELGEQSVFSNSK